MTLFKSRADAEQIERLTEENLTLKKENELLQAQLLQSQNSLREKNDYKPRGMMEYQNEQLKKNLLDIQKNMETYLLQAGKILDIENIEIVKNGDWLEKLNFADVLQLAGSFTASQMMQRDMFKKRIEQKKDINLVEFFYPLMQGYDSVPIKADVEIGGTDQLFNLMAGRKIQEHFGMPAQNIITVPILEGLDGHEKMSKSLQNYIGILDSYSDIFGKIMSIPDELMEKYFLLLTQKSVEEIAEILTIHPRDAKITLAKIITAELHSQDLADKAEEEFKALFAGTGKNKNAIPDDITEKTIDAGNFDILNIAIQTGLFSTNSEARRKVEEGAFKIDGNKYTNIKEEFQLIAKEEYVMQFGKRHFIKICVK